MSDRVPFECLQKPMAWLRHPWAKNVWASLQLSVGFHIYSVLLARGKKVRFVWVLKQTAPSSRNRSNQLWSWKSQVGNRKLDARIWKSEIASRKSEVGRQNLEVRNPTSEVGRQTVKVRGWKSEVFDLGLFSNLNFSDFCAFFFHICHKLPFYYLRLLFEIKLVSRIMKRYF